VHVIVSAPRDSRSEHRHETRAGRRTGAANHPRAEDLEDAATLLRALGNRLRLAVITILEDGPECVHELVEALDVEQPLISQHLRILRSVDLVRTERRGKEVVYSLADHHVAHIVRNAITHTQETQEKK